nr:hypothetical protein [Candidatus Gracilibacteria bacterium]
MDKYLFFSILASIIYIFGAIPYVYHSFKNDVVPHPFTWGVWFILISINFYGVLVSEVGIIPLIPISIRLFFILLGTALGIYFIRKIKISFFDYFCLFLALMCIFIFYIFGLSDAILATIFVDMLVVAPTIKKIYLNPYSEDLLVWITTMFTQVFLFLSIQNHTFDNSSFWIYMFFENLFVAIFIFFRRRFIKLPVGK